MTFEEFFEQVKEHFAGTDVSDITDHLAFQFNIVGDAEGIFYVEVKEGGLHVEPYDYKDFDAKFITSADTLMKIAAGKKDPLFAFTVGQLNIEGDHGKALKLKDIVSKSLDKKSDAKKAAKKKK